MTSYSTQVALVPTGDANPPTFRMNASGDVVIDLAPGGDHRLLLGAHHNPAYYLRQLAQDAEMMALEVEVEQARQARLAGDAA